jgi:hypothetical protein
MHRVLETRKETESLNNSHKVISQICGRARIILYYFILHFVYFLAKQESWRNVAKIGGNGHNISKNTDLFRSLYI